ncbi:hypothetical protein MMC09_001901 [Bachmanniomyces sp. S44760]|nr:hypothetical protein [Bachmanniomyces sp. S44760]
MQLSSSEKGFSSLNEVIPRRSFQKWLIFMFFTAFTILAAVYLFGDSSRFHLSTGNKALASLYSSKSETIPPTLSPHKPHDFKVVALVFWGRRDRTSILKCYLKKNLVENGGSLDEVVFLVRTDDHDDLAYLDEVLKESSSYSRYPPASNGSLPGQASYNSAWNIPIIQNGTMYFKIDDDVVYINNNTFSSMIATKAAHPEYLLVSANSINQPALSWIHYSLGAIHPYLPEHQPVEYTSATSWRPSTLPTWTKEKSGPAAVSSQDYTQVFSAPHEHHRWLPLRNGTNTDWTPINQTGFKPGGPGWNHWTIAVQEHYSFLQNLEAGELHRYNFGIWDYHYNRISINMIAIWGDDILAHRPFKHGSDEEYLTMILSKQLGRSAVVDGRAIASHYSFGSQHGKATGSKQGIVEHGIEWSDVLSRYRAYAEENVC